MYPFFNLLGRQIPAYGLSIVIAVFLVGRLACRYGGKVALAWEDVLIVGASALLSGFLCGVLLYIFVTYSPSQVLAMLRNGDFRFLSGGLVFYGALVGGLAGGLIGTKLSKAPLAAVEKSVIPYIPIGHAIGRIGCMLAGCCYGAPYDGPCAIYYPNSRFGLAPHQGCFPVQPLEAILNLAIALCLMRLRKKEPPKWSLLFSYLGMYGIVRFFLEFLRGDAIRGVAGGLSTSQWISLAILCLCMIYFLFKKPKKYIENAPHMFRNMIGFYREKDVIFVSDLEKAKQLLRGGTYTCVLCADGDYATTTLRGVKPLVEWLQAGESRKGFCAADKVVGKATAFLYCLLGAKAVYASVMSRPAMTVLQNHGIYAECDKPVENIINRAGNGICPFEEAVLDIEEPEAAYRAILTKMEAMGIR